MSTIPHLMLGLTVSMGDEATEWMKALMLCSYQCGGTHSKKLISDSKIESRAALAVESLSLSKMYGSIEVQEMDIRKGLPPTGKDPMCRCILLLCVSSKHCTYVCHK